jgi:hypothetical protein
MPTLSGTVLDTTAVATITVTGEDHAAASNTTTVGTSIVNAIIADIRTITNITSKHLTRFDDETS